jgi:signal recognition particle GTPase
MTDLRYLDRALRDKVEVSKEKLKNYRACLSSMSNYEKNEFRILLARSKRLNHSP